jgi:hypothetical protein
MRDYLQHGRRHGPTGSDPIPGLANVDFASLEFFGGSVTVHGSGGGTVAIPWTEFNTTSTEVFGTGGSSGSPPTNTTGDLGLLLQGTGVYIVMAAAKWESGAANISSTINVSDGNNLTEIDYKAIELLVATTFAAITQEINPSSFQMVSVFSGDVGFVTLNLQNLDIPDWDCVSALMACIFWPTGDLVTVYS